MKYRFSECRILVFAKEPVLGKVKTRLQSHLGQGRALALHCALISYQVKQIISSRLAPVELWVSANPHHELFRSLVPASSIFVQQGADLGQKMHHAFCHSLQTSSATLIVGADCPSVDKTYLIDALQALGGGTEAVFGPAEDGGYVLVGLTQQHAELFENISWGGAKVMSETTNHLQQSGMSWRLLDKRWDVDRPQDLVRLENLDPPLRY